MGMNDNGMLGLGHDKKNTKNKAIEIKFPDNQKIKEAKIGKGQVLALTQSGRVYGWGINNHGQVGVLNIEEVREVKPK